MIFQVGTALEYEVNFPSTIIFSVHVQHNPSQIVLLEKLLIHPDMPFEEFELDGNRFVRMQTAGHTYFALHYSATVDCNYEVCPTGEIAVTPLETLANCAIPYLFPSRYCQSDRLGKLAWDLFGDIENSYDKVTAIVEWIHANVEYVPGSTHSQTSAYDTVTQRVGVCRDFAHLGIALCRALNIPARYFTGYAYELEPPDFHACFECFLGDKWMAFDATHLAPLNGIVRIARGRDAADAAVASVFGSVNRTAMEVSCTLAEGQRFIPISRPQLRGRGVALPADAD